MTLSAIIVAAGSGSRFGGESPKQFRMLGGMAVLNHSLRAFDSYPGCSQIIIVAAPDRADAVRDLLPDDMRLTPMLVTGGKTRSASVRAGLDAAQGELVLIHDAARPLVSHAIMDRVVAALATHDAAAPALAVSDALWRGAGDEVTDTVVRDGLFRAQTPQGFDLAALRAAHAAYAGDAADDVEVARAAGLAVRIVAGAEENFKITHPDDLTRAERILRAEATATDIRVGNGYDVHRFGPGDQVTLCGVTLPFSRALQGHSDADVGMHALTDAIYGALAEGDIGQHFPPSDPQWKGAESHIFLRHAVDLAARKGYRLSQADVTLVCELPKIGPHQSAMRAALAAITGTSADRISVKATTSERLGFTGRGEGIAALATATLTGT